MSDAALVIPTGAALVGSYGPDVAPYNTGVGGAMALPSARRVATGMDYKPDLVLDPKHCQWHQPDADGVDSQCGSWPVKKDNPERYCAGHLKKASANGAQPGPDQDVRTNAS